MKIQLKLIVYGKNSFEKEKFTPITNRDWCKPSGGLWTSLVDSKWGWKDWCLNENFGIESLKIHFLLSYSGNALRVDSLKDAQQMIWRSRPKEYSFLKNTPDFEQMQKNGIDAIWLTPQGEAETRFNDEYNLYGWDCESVLVMNPDCLSIPTTTLTRNLEF